MGTEFRFPDVGEGIHEGTIVKWLFQEGDNVKADQTIVEVETDKAVVELPSPSSGTILKINHKVGELVKVGEILVVIGDKNEKRSEKTENEVPVAVKEMIKSTSSIPYSRSSDSSVSIQNKNHVSSDPKFSSIKDSNQTKEILAAPSTRKLARDMGVDLSKVSGTGPGGRILTVDVQKSKTNSTVYASLVNQSGNKVKENLPTEHTGAQELSYSAQYAHLTADKIIPLSNIRKVIAERMVYSKTHIPHACAMDLVDVTSLVEIREREKLAAQNKGIKLTYLPFIVKAIVLSMRKYPLINSHFDEQKSEIIMRAQINIGIAVDSEEGLIVPVIKDADKKTILAIASEIEQLATLSRERKIKLDDLKGGTFTITNVGSNGGLFSTPIINPPEVAILGVHRIKDMPMAVNGKVEIRKVLGLSICFDHRVLDGALATLFLTEVKNYLEDPGLMLVGLV